MNISKMNDDLKIIAKLDDKPILSSEELKMKFDESGLKIKNYLNNILVEDLLKIEIPLIEDSLDSNSRVNAPSVRAVNDIKADKQNKIIITNVVPTDSDGEEGDIWLVWS